VVPRDVDVVVKMRRRTYKTRSGRTDRYYLYLKNLKYEHDPELWSRRNYRKMKRRYATQRHAVSAVEQLKRGKIEVVPWMLKSHPHYRGWSHQFLRQNAPREHVRYHKARF